ncbi:MAG: helix-turn-helix transcriptional regulator [Gudongella sp.]|jgi:transcriptional regulator with XRE-family HTH domain|nr:helix-turn-helix transcriptional regulator [Gudongella sp.]
MILADKILYHRKKLGLSQEELAEQLNVSRQSISKWEGAQSIPDMDKIIKLSDIFSVSIDYLLKDEIQEAEYIDGKDIASLRRVSLEEANTFIEANKKHAKNIAIGVFLCIASPVLLILLNNFYENGFGPLNGDVASALGLVILITMVAAAIPIFIKSNNSMEPYAFLKEDSFEIEYGVESAVRKEKEIHRNDHIKNLSLGIVIIIVSIIPAIISEALKNFPIIYSIAPALLISMVAIGVHLVVKTSIYNSSFSIILQEGNYTPSKKKSNVIYGRIAGIYWLSTVTLYLAISFIFNKWDSSWVIWPIAGVLFGVISIIASIFIDD